MIESADMASSSQQVASLPDIPQGDHSQGSEESAPEGQTHTRLRERPKSRRTPVRFINFVLRVEDFSKRGVV